MVIPPELRRRFGLAEGSLIIAEATEDGVLIRPAVAVPADAQWRHRLLEQANRDYAELRGDPEAWQATLAEREVWDATLLDGLDRGEVRPD